MYFSMEFLSVRRKGFRNNETNWGGDANSSQYLKYIFDSLCEKDGSENSTGWKVRQWKDQKNEPAWQGFEVEFGQPFEGSRMRKK